jgi:hypothetical protein
MAARGGLVYGVGALRAAARGERMLWALHRAALVHGLVPVVPALTVAESFRVEVRGDRLSALLAGSEVESVSPSQARRIGELAARADTVDLAAASVAETADRRHLAVIASRQNALKSCAELLGHDLVHYVV